MTPTTLTSIKVMGVNRRWIEVQAEVYGDYAVHYVLYAGETNGEVFAVSHIASGMMVAINDVLDEARGFAQEMNDKNIEDALKAVRRQAPSDLPKKPWFRKLLTKYRMGIYLSRDHEAGRPVLYFGR